MSSHHFVKEGQEPALFIVDALSLHKAEPLLEWAPLVLVSENALDDVLIWGIKIDAVLVSHLDEMLAAKIEHQQPVSVISFDPATEDFVKVGIEFLRLKKSSAVNVMCNISVRDFSTQHTDVDFQCSLLNNDARWSLIRNHHFEKWLDAGSSLLLYAQHPHDVALEGTLLQSDNVTLFNTQAGVVKIRSGDNFWIGELF